MLRLLTTANAHAKAYKNVITDSCSFFLSKNKTMTSFIHKQLL